MTLDSHTNTAFGSMFALVIYNPPTSLKSSTKHALLTSSNINQMSDPKYLILIVRMHIYNILLLI